jgi:hypothetical protein
MSTEFTLLSDIDGLVPIALQLLEGENNRQTVRFAFPRVLLDHVRNLHVEGGDGEATTIGELFDNATTVDFLEEDCSPQELLSFGTIGSREQAKLAWEMT